jgi:glycosyltransferase involved in cell wall biosynthesis
MWRRCVGNLSTLLEATAFRLPVVASSVGGNVEVLSRGGDLLVPAKDVGALFASVAQLLADPPAREEIGRETRRVIANHYSLDVMLATLDTMYQCVLGDNPC